MKLALKQVLAAALAAVAAVAATAQSSAPAASKPASAASAASTASAASGGPARASLGNVDTLEGGIVVTHTKRGAGEKPVAADRVKVHYKGYFPPGGPKAGEEFDSSYKRNEPATFPLGRVIKCWTLGVATMQPGGKATLTCPAAVAYGERGTPGGPIGPNQTLMFDVELLEVLK